MVADAPGPVDPPPIRLGDVQAAVSRYAIPETLHSAVCAGLMPLDEAQRLMAGDWIAAWEAAGRP